MNKIRVQISFSKDADLENVRNQLLELNNGTYKFYSCFLPRDIVIEKGWSTDIVDLIDEVLGNEHSYVSEDYMGSQNFEEFMKDLPAMREYTADLVNIMFVLDSGTAAGVAEEIRLFTNKKVILLP